MPWWSRHRDSELPPTRNTGHTPGHQDGIKRHRQGCPRTDQDVLRHLASPARTRLELAFWDPYLLRAVSHCFTAAGSRCIFRVTEPETEVIHLSKCATEQGGDQKPTPPSQGPFLSTGHPALSPASAPSIHTLLKRAIFYHHHVVLLLGKEAAGPEVTKGVCCGVSRRGNR